MPRNVRNFWIAAEIDGRGSKLASGPVGKDGGFSCRIFIRRDGDVESGVTLRGVAHPDGTLEILCMGQDEHDNVVGRFTVLGRR